MATTKESLLLDTFLAGSITKELYDSKVLVLHNEKISLTKQIEEAKTREPMSVLEPTKKVFLEASRAKNEFLAGDDFKKRNILENLCWNLSIKDKNIQTVSLRSPFDIMWKAPKNADISQMRRVRDSVTSFLAVARNSRPRLAARIAMLARSVFLISTSHAMMLRSEAI